MARLSNRFPVTRASATRKVERSIQSAIRKASPENHRVTHHPEASQPNISPGNKATIERFINKYANEIGNICVANIRRILDER